MELSHIQGFVTLGIFIAGILGILTKRIPLPVQTVLLLVTLLNVLTGAAFRLILPEGGGFSAVMMLPAQVLGGIILHPVTALLAGLFLAGALQASGGFAAIADILQKARKTFLGLPGTLVILCMLPLIASLPCGRILGAALLPLIFAFGPIGMGILSKPQTVILIGAFARNAFGSCGPSPIGGVGQAAEGMLGKVGYLRGAEAFSLLLGTAFMALFLKWISVRLYPEEISIRETEEKKEVEVRPPFKGYLALLIFAASLIVSLFELFGKIPVQTILLGGALLILIVARLNLEDLMAGIIILPATAMIAGFLAAGSLDATGGFAALKLLFVKVADLKIGGSALLGTAGMLALIVQIQTILPLSCSRILTAAFVPVIYLFGPAGAGLVNDQQLAVLMAAFIINATTSCAPSPLGGAGMMAEGAARAEPGFLRPAFSFVSLAVLTPLSALFMKFISFPFFEGGAVALPAALSNLGWVFGILLINTALVRASGLLQKTGPAGGGNKVFTFLSFMLAGALAGAVLAYALDMTSGREIAQGTLGGLISGLLVALLMPK